MDVTIEKKHKGLGIASFVIAVSFFVLTIVLFGVAGAIRLSGSETPMIDALLGLIIMLFWVVELVAVGLGIGGLFDKSSKKVFPILGVAISGGCVILTAATVGYGMYVNAHGGRSAPSPAVFQKAETSLNLTRIHI